MIPFLFLVLFLLVWMGLAYVLTSSAMTGRLGQAGPAAVGRSLQSRNRLILGVTLVILALMALMEALLPAASEAIQNLQYGVADATGSDLSLFYSTSNGSLSWGLYLAIFLGTLGGLIAGTLMAIRRFPILRGLTLGSII